MAELNRTEADLACVEGELNGLYDAAAVLDLLARELDGLHQLKADDQGHELARCAWMARDKVNGFADGVLNVVGDAGSHE